MGSTRLVSTASVEEQWRDVAGPWLRERTASAWKSPLPTVILTPSRAESFYLKGRLMTEGVAFLGLRFWTPSDARQFLLAELSPGITVATQAELRLLARICAEDVLDQTRDDNATLGSVVREPAAFLRAYDLMLGAGWDPARDGAVYGHTLARAMRNELSAHGVASQAGIHRILHDAIESRKNKLIADLLVVGFNATHWPLWDLLKATVGAAENAVIALAEPRVFGEGIDGLWTGSWEQQTAAVVAPAVSTGDAVFVAPSPFSPLVASYEQGTRSMTGVESVSLLVTTDITSQIQAVTLQALDYLKADVCTRLGILFPEPNALALGVADRLRQLGIPLNDGIGFLAPGIFVRRSWTTWLELQEEPGVPQLIAWLRACEAEQVSCGNESAIPARRIADILDDALGDTLVDNLDFLSHHLADSRGAEHELVANFLQERVVLPAEASFSTYLALTRQAFEGIGWEDHLDALNSEPPAWLQGLPREFSRRIFLEWLREATDSQTRTRGAEGNHFYGKVHLLLYAQMSGQTWSHLILTGQNEGIWPRVVEAGAFGSRHEMELLNRRARQLNRSGTTQGSQGEGHETVLQGHGHCLLPLERHDLALRDLCTALESTSEAVSLAALTTSEGRSLLPSDFFNHVAQGLLEQPLDEDSFRLLAIHTEKWINENESLIKPKPDTGIEPASSVRTQGIATTGVAHAARRDLSHAFGPYEFAFAEPPADPVQLFCKRWEDAWKNPATVWLADVVGAEPWPEGNLSWSRAVGTWTHRWLASALRTCRERKAPEELPVLLWAAADRDARRIEDRARVAGIALYPWWAQVWAQARKVALSLSDALMPHLVDRPFLTEQSLRGEMIALPGSTQADFLLRGRIDLLLLDIGAEQPELGAKEFPGRECWVVDFKTGSAGPLNARTLAKGRGLQALLYGLAMRAGGAKSTAISVLNPEVVLKQQIRLDDFVGLEPLFHSLEKMHRDGVFGQRPGAVSDYGYSPEFPIATRFVPDEILQEKWEMLHGQAASGEENG